MKRIISGFLSVLILLLSFNIAFAQDAEENVSVVSENTAPLSREAEIISALGIYTASDEDKSITYGEWASALVNIAGVDFGAAEKIYYDIEKTDPIAKNITSAYYLGILDTAKGGRIKPERTVSYNQAVKMIAKVLGYGNFVETDSYQTIVSGIKCVKNIDFANQSALTCGDAVKILYKMLEEEVADSSSTQLKRHTGETVMSRYLHMEKITGIADASRISGLRSSDYTDAKMISINGKVYSAPFLERGEEYLGYRVEGYLKENSTGEYELIYIGKYKNETKVIYDTDIENITSDKIEYEVNGKTLHVDISGNEDLVFNEVASPLFSLKSLHNEKFNGYIELISNDSDSEYEVIKIYSYKNYVIKSITGELRIATKENKGTLDFSEYRLSIIEKPDGTPAVAADFSNETLISVFDSGTEDYVKIIVTPKNAVGYVTGRAEDEGVLYIDSNEYNTDSDFFGTYGDRLQNGKISVLIDWRGKIGAISEEDSENGFRWGYLCDMNRKEGFDEPVMVKIFDSEGKMNRLELYKNVYLDGEMKKDSKVLDYFSDIEISTGGKYCKRQFIRFAVNSNGQVTDIDTSVRTSYENDDSNKTVSIDDNFAIIDNYTIFGSSNYTMAKDAKIFVIPVDSGGEGTASRNFDDDDYAIVNGAGIFVPFNNLTLKLEFADIDKANIANLVAVRETHYKTPVMGGGEMPTYNKVLSYMVYDISSGLDEEGNIRPILKYFSQRDNNTVQKAFAEDSETLMKPVYDSNGKTIPGQYKPLSRGDVVRLKFNYAGTKITGVAVDFDVDRTDNDRFKVMSVYYVIGVAKAKSAVGLNMFYKAKAGAPAFNGNNADEVFDFNTTKISRISRIIDSGYITVYDRKTNKVYAGGYNDLLDYDTSSENLPIIVNRMRNNAQLGIFVIK